jgi:hypothetical protein
MRTVKVILIAVFSLAILAGAGLFLTGYFAPKPAGIRVETNPKASVFINGSLVGETPFEGSYKAGTIILRLVPEGSAENLIPFETSMTLASGIQTAVGRNFGVSEDVSEGYIISFEKTAGQNAGLAVVSQPDNAEVLVDGVSRGFSTYSISTIAPAMHTITMKSPDYLDFSKTVKTLPGYRLTFYAKLAKVIGKSETLGTESQTTVKMVKILDTPTGYLRVRSAPGTGGREIAQVKPGDSFPFIDTDVATGWIEIQYEASKSGLPSGITGWVSGQYATISSKIQ